MVHGAYPSALMTGAARMPLTGPCHGAEGPGLGPGANHAAATSGPGLGRSPKELGDGGLYENALPFTTAAPSSPTPSRNTTASNRPPRKLRPAPPPPPRTPPRTPPRLRPAPPPPQGTASGPASGSASGPPPRRMTTMDIQPAPPYGVGVVPPRSYTSVNLTLRPPAADQPPIDIRSAGSSLTYSSSSYDPRQGYQSQLQIRIGPGGLGSVSATRTRAPPAPVPPPPSPATPPAGAPRPPQLQPPRLMSPLPELEEPDRRPAASREDLVRAVMAMGGAELCPDMREHLVRQLERRTLLETELHRERNKLQAMQREVAEMERDLERRTAQARPRGPPALPVMEKVQRLRTEIQALQEECTRMTSEVDAKAPETRLEENVSEPGWTCQTCTFHNHYLLEACETCDVPRIHLGSDSVQRRNGNSSPSSLHALRLPDFSPSSIGILPSLASPALDAALATSMPNAMCVPNMLTPSPGHEE